MPAVLGAVASVVVVASAKVSDGYDDFDIIFQNGTGYKGSMHQLAATGLTATVGVIGGVMAATSSLRIVGLLTNMDPGKFFEDAVFWEMDSRMRKDAV